MDGVKKEHKGLNAERDKYKDLCKEGGFKPNPTFLKALGTSILDLTVVKKTLSKKVEKDVNKTEINQIYIEQWTVREGD